MRGADLLDCGQYLIAKDGVLPGKLSMGTGLRVFAGTEAMVNPCVREEESQREFDASNVLWSGSCIACGSPRVEKCGGCSYRGTSWLQTQRNGCLDVRLKGMKFGGIFIILEIYKLRRSAPWTQSRHRIFRILSQHGPQGQEPDHNLSCERGQADWKDPFIR